MSTTIYILTSDTLHQYGITVRHSAYGDNETEGDVQTIQTQVWLTPEQLQDLQEKIVAAQYTMAEKRAMLLAEKDKENG